MSTCSKNNDIRGKMKNKIKLLVMALIASVISVVSVSEASANCTAEDPCGTWAMLDNQGTVTNVIVCQASVCGGGTWAGQTVVPQVAPNPVTHDTSGQGSYIGNPNLGTSVVYSDGRFNIVESTTIVREQVDIETNSVTVSKAEIPVSSRSFSYEDTIGKSYGNVEMSVGLVDESRDTKISVAKIDSDGYQYESEIMRERKSSDELRASLAAKNLNLMISKINTLIKLLRGFLK